MPPRAVVASLGTRKSFLVLFFKKEQRKKRTAFLKKSSKKLLSVGRAPPGSAVPGGQAWSGGAPA
jgi:hypothetical protein